MLYIFSLFVVLGPNVDGNKRKKLILFPVTAFVSSTIIVSALWLIIKKCRRKRGKYIL